MPAPSADPSGPEATARAHDESLWRNLFLLVEAGEVVPIVGRELLQVGTPPTHLYATLAQGVAKRLNVPFDPGEPVKDPLNTVACRYLERSDDTRQIYIAVFQEAQALSSLGVPEPFRHLAEIDRFKLFVTTIFDASLETAINTVRFNGLPRTDVRSFAPKRVKDLPGTLESLTLLEDTTDSNKRGGRYLVAFASGTKMIWTVALSGDGGVSFDGTNAPA